MDVKIACVCPPIDGQFRHPDGDQVTLHEPILPRVRRALLYDLQVATDAGMVPTIGDQMALLSEGYLLRCIDAWTVVAANGKPLPPSREAIAERILDNASAYDALARAADDLYAEAVLLPLLLGASSSSSAGPTNGSTSPRTNGATPRTKRSGRSSTTSIPTVVTGPMPSSSAGVSSS